MFLIKFIKNWTLPVAMCFGAIAYVIFTYIAILRPVKSLTLDFIDILTPALIFLMLFFTFCKVDLHQLRPRMWHMWLLLLQIGICGSLVGSILYFQPSLPYKIFWEAMLACVLAPTATAAAVVTGKLGGNSATLTSYTLISNVFAAFMITSFCPLVELQTDISFWGAFSKILSQVTRLLILPFLVAWFIRRYFPKFHSLCLKPKNIAFYLWGISLAIVTAQTIRFVVNNSSHPGLEWAIALGCLFMCCIQFFIGKVLGGHYGQRISGGQAFGQKNTIFAIWMAYTYLNPLSAIGPGSYVMWQNIINSWQLWKKRKKDEVR